ncbi:MAG: hypothetical protein Q8S44_02495 [Flavobacteriaceae bacterium]|nr:hypothetical protein [Flavobacteriaceae bacterium]
MFYWQGNDYLCLKSFDGKYKNRISYCLNLSCTVGHDSIIGNFSSIMPSVNISREVTINDSVYIGTKIKIINQIEIGKDTILGSGAGVSKSLPAKCIAVEIPAKQMKFHK